MKKLFQYSPWIDTKMKKIENQTQTTIKQNKNGNNEYKNLPYSDAEKEEGERRVKWLRKTTTKVMGVVVVAAAVFVWVRSQNKTRRITRIKFFKHKVSDKKIILRMLRNFDKNMRTNTWELLLYIRIFILCIWQLLLSLQTDLGTNKWTSS